MKAKWELSHLGIVVKDINVVKNFIESSQLGELREVSIEEPEGKQTSQVSLHLDSLRIDFMQFVPDAFRLSEPMKNYSEGLHHIAFLVDDIDNEVKKLRDKGVEVLFEEEFNGGPVIQKGKIVFLNTTKIGGTLLELQQIEECIPEYLPGKYRQE